MPEVKNHGLAGNRGSEPEEIHDIPLIRGSEPHQHGDSIQVADQPNKKVIQNRKT
jgi:hypothetical protein